MSGPLSFAENSFSMEAEESIIGIAPSLMFSSPRKWEKEAEQTVAHELFHLLMADYDHLAVASCGDESIAKELLRQSERVVCRTERALMRALGNKRGL